MNALYVMARTLESIDLAVIFCFISGYIVPLSWRKTRLVHLRLLWTVFIAQVSCKLHCPLLIYANDLRKLAGSEEIDPRFQPTFFNLLAGLSSPAIASVAMTAAVLLGPAIGWYLYRQYDKRIQRNLRMA